MARKIGRKSRAVGSYVATAVADERVTAFVPLPLPPASPPLHLEGRLADRLRLAERALVRLDLAGDMVPSLDWFIYAFVRKEAVITSQIEGTQATLVDLFAFESGDRAEPNAEVRDVCNYLDALDYARAELRKDKGLPLSMRLLNEAHRRLMQGARGANEQPGEVRRSQNWIGGSRPGNAVYIPPPPQKLGGLLSAFEKYIHAGNGLPELVRAGLLHAQFETIHPYLDGNGRIGRLLIALLLEHWGLLHGPLLYLSLFFKRHREEYYRRLNAVRTDGDWEGWLDFFLDGVATIADEAVASARDLFAQINADRVRLLGAGAASVSAVRLFDQLPRQPILSVTSAMQLLKTTKPTATRAIDVMARLGILVEITGRKRDRSFAYQAYLDRLKVGTDLEFRTVGPALVRPVRSNKSAAKPEG
ncbi:MAG TPA: Fic family protein [Rhizomicrobium sp.]|nr:Fic family protein [Rhizomicrobium sp.]